MPESPEHFFLKTEFLNVLDDFSKTSLYKYAESERKKFDMSCLLTTNWEQSLIGQTMWGNETGIDKDIRGLIANPDAHIWAYVIKDTIKSRSLLYEIIQDYKKTEYRDKLFKFKVFWIPSDFDADNDKDRDAIGTLLQDSIVEDLLFNVVFGNLTTRDFHYFINEILGSGFFGLGLAVLSYIAVNGMGNFVSISETLDVSKGSIREKFFQIRAREFITGSGLVANVSLKGRILLSIVKRLVEEYESQRFSTEFIFILSKLGHSIEVINEANEKQIILTEDLKYLIKYYYHAKRYSGFTLDESQFIQDGQIWHFKKEK